MIKRLLMGGLLCWQAINPAAAQVPCATPSVEQLTPEHRAALRQIEEQTQRYVQQQQALEGTAQRPPGWQMPYDIPVVVHIIYNTAAQNVTDSQVDEQIERLNIDFSRGNADAVSTPAAFAGRAAGSRIRFRRASIDPQGRCTDGIVRRQTWRTQFIADPSTIEQYMKFTADGGDDAWDPNQYLNIWVCNLRAGNGPGGIPYVRVGGFASFPGGPAPLDGVVIAYDLFGTTNTQGLGRVGTHEVGHWLNLRHIWGDANCGDDQVADTPTQQTSNYGCPAFPHQTCGNGPDGDMFMNYMDYTNDGCKNMFTLGQVQRMEALFQPGGARHSLLYTLGQVAHPVFLAGTPKDICKSGRQRFEVYPVCKAVSYKFEISSADFRASFAANGAQDTYTTTQPWADVDFFSDGYYNKIITVTVTTDDGNVMSQSMYFYVNGGEPPMPSFTFVPHNGNGCRYDVEVPLDPRATEYTVEIVGSSQLPQTQQVPPGATSGVLLFPFQLNPAQTVNIIVTALNACDKSILDTRANVPAAAPGCNASEGRPAPAVAARAEAAKLTAFPNPSTAAVTLSVPGASGAQSAVIRNLAGQVVQQVRWEGPSTTVSVAELPAGLYVVEARSGKGSLFTRLVVNRP